MKRIVSIILVLTLICCMIPTAFAASSEATEAADALHNLGLFNGTGADANGNPIYDLDRAPNRAEAVTMLVRLLGKESEAKAGTWTTPFADVADWSKPYVGYAYANKLTSGTSATTFGGSATITASQYLTLVLRALGYESGTDFQWDKAWELSDKIGLTNGRYNAGSKKFVRGDVAQISKSALSMTIKDEAGTLVEELVNNETVSMGDALFAGVAPGTETVTFDAKIESGNYSPCTIRRSDLQQLFPEMKNFSMNNTSAFQTISTTLDDYLCKDAQMETLIMTQNDGWGYSGQEYGMFAGQNPFVIIMLYSNTTTLCGYFIGEPEKIGNDTYRFNFTRCKYDITGLYEQENAELKKFSSNYIPVEEVASSDAAYFMKGNDHQSPRYDDSTLTQQFFLFEQLTADRPNWPMYSMGKFQEVKEREPLANGNWRCYLLLDSNKQPIGYTVLEAAS